MSQDRLGGVAACVHGRCERTHAAHRDAALETGLLRGGPPLAVGPGRLGPGDVGDGRVPEVDEVLDGLARPGPVVGDDARHAVDLPVEHHQRGPAGHGDDLGVIHPRARQEQSGDDGARPLEGVALEPTRLLCVGEDEREPSLGRSALGTPDDLEVERVGDVGNDERDHVRGRSAGTTARSARHVRSARGARSAAGAVATGAAALVAQGSPDPEDPLGCGGVEPARTGERP